MPWVQRTGQGNTLADIDAIESKHQATAGLRLLKESRHCSNKTEVTKGLCQESSDKSHEREHPEKWGLSVFLGW